MTTTNAKVASRRAAPNVYRGTDHTAYAQQVTKAFRFTFALAFSYSLTFFIYVLRSLYILHIRLVQVLKI